MRAGNLRHRIIIQENTPTKGTYGSTTDVWTTHSTTRASVESINGREYQGDGQVRSDTTHKFVLRVNRSLSTITPKMRISWNSRVFDIQSRVDPNERRKFQIIMAKERL